jgi:hypothetical protein
VKSCKTGEETELDIHKEVGKRDVPSCESESSSSLHEPLYIDQRDAAFSILSN